MNRLLLIGFMCSGKSTVGRLVAQRLGMPFIDLDRVIEARVGPLLPFVQREGEEAFRKIESEVLRELLSGEAAVIATGGGTPTVAGNLDQMLRAGTIIWLDVPLDALMPRIERAGGDRPLLFGLKGDALRARVVDLLESRMSAYIQAQVHVDGAGTPDEVAARIEAEVSAQRR
ncbi:MAG TPA: shikimate kinase [Flavobacteriales bacterium]|nr:shikimate kinase [Flavobacteriales bacterium]